LLLEKVKDIDGLLCLLTDRIDQQLIEAGASLKVISQMAVGYDNIDIPLATARGIPVGNTPDVLTDATADFAWSLLMAAARRVVEADRFTRAGYWQTWEPDLLLGSSIAGATLGIYEMLGPSWREFAQRRYPNAPNLRKNRGEGDYLTILTFDAQAARMISEVPDTDEFWVLFEKLVRVR